MVVRLAPGASVRDLKAALRSSFPPAQVAPSFHLFLKGAKLRLDAEVGSLAIGDGEFVVLVPFTRSPQQCSSVSVPSQEQGVNPPKQPEVSAAASSAWQDIMDDLSAMPSSPQSDIAPKDFYSSSGPCSGTGRSAEDTPPCQSSSIGSSRKRKTACKENGNGSPESLPSGENGTAEKQKRNMSKKSGVARSAATSCHDTHPLEPAEMAEHLKQGLGKEGQIVHIQEIPSREASFTELPCHLSEAMREALASIGISRLYSHQALAQDQLRTLLEMKNEFHTDIIVKIYDGDTPREDRLCIRDNARLLITNPDMLHVSILPYHGQFQRILSNLRYIVIDEAHSYKGAFGCHTALIIRRLKRICSNVYGSHPTFIFCTATSANPCEHVMELANLDEVELIQNDGSPCGSNSIVEVSYLFAEMVQHGLRCIAFCKTRKLCELVLAYTREILQESAKGLVDSICVYRAGYIAEDRRKIEADLFGGKLRGVAATNALELGIDVGHIDATLHLGFPGSIASLWQQAGRSGRRAKQSLAIYVAFEGPLDQYFMKFPHKLFGKPIEHCHVDSRNLKVLGQQFACAAYEHPLCLQYDEHYFGSSLDSAMTTLKDKGYIINNPSGPFSSSMWNYIGPERSPSQAVSIRAIEHDKYQVIDKLNNRLLEEIEESKAFFQVYEGAVYMHQGVNYLVEELDLSSRIAFCRKADLKYYTERRDYTDINVLGGEFALVMWLFRHMMCSASDLGTECANPHETRGIPDRILLYDKHPGGIGIASQAQMLFGELLLAALELVSTCSCTGAAGCPNCIQSLTCSEYNEVLDKEAAILILKGVIDYERAYFEAEDACQQS
ncbi:putative ATP-dependent helicase YprA-like [Panicum miliaceum]|uniref:ATP-dependent helicase YprA-like n=1 Tax=Panicum miliaceum TaxID=4540 RepID=A0A3L6TCK3_PANMI|nr:putative ATP-dependent helicase YprA-like [Panicum miliaceum]